jgi:NADH-quinone oxidoreductase subunit L
VDDFFAVQHAYLIPLLPLIAAGIAGFFGAKWLRGQSHWPIWLGVGGSAVISFSLLAGMYSLWQNAINATLWISHDWYTWIITGTTFQASAGFLFDPLSAVMLCVVTGIGFLIMVFAAGYMKGESGYFRFFAYLGLFIFAMTCLVMGNNFVMLYLGWEGVGLCSYLLIGYYYDKPSAVAAAKKAFLVNRIGDFGFGLGIMLIWKVFHTVSYFGDADHPGALILAMHPNAAQLDALKYIPFLLMVGAFGKSAQFPLYVWLPDAMEGPTPVSALIHAATMVTAGVYMIARCGTMFVGNSAAMMTIACVGCFTALLAATIALRQFDLKKVFAYSTISQLGYMFVGVGVLAPVAGVFHLVTHAFFKALLFLASGVVMHAMHGELDMRKMSGVKKVLPLTNILMLVGCLALAGFPGFSGFFSKDEIISAAMAKAPVIGVIMLITAFMTAYYTFRLYFRVFQGPEVIPAPPSDEHGHGGHDSHGEEEHHSREPFLMMFPLVILAIGALGAGVLNFSKTDGLGAFLGASPSFQNAYDTAKASGVEVPAEQMGQIETAEAHPESGIPPVMIVSACLSVLGILLAMLLHLKDRAAGDALAARLQPLTSLIEHKFYVDEIYDALIVQPLWNLGRIFRFIDQMIVDGIVEVVGFIPKLSGFVLKLTMQRGYLQGYAASMLFGMAIILMIIFMHH